MISKFILTNFSENFKIHEKKTNFSNFCFELFRTNRTQNMTGTTPFKD